MAPLPPPVDKIVPKGKNIDFGWEWNGMVDPNNTKKVRCDFCGDVSNGGITRAKYHQMGVGGGVSSCKDTPEHVKEKLREARNKKKDEKGAYGSEDEEIREISNLMSKARRRVPMSPGTCESSNRIYKGPMGMYLSEPREVTNNSKKRQARVNDKEAKAATDQIVARFIYTNDIPFNVVRSKSFKMMIKAIANYGPGLKAPSYHEMIAHLSEEEKMKMLRDRANLACKWMLGEDEGSGEVDGDELQEEVDRGHRAAGAEGSSMTTRRKSRLMNSSTSRPTSSSAKAKGKGVQIDDIEEEEIDLVSGDESDMEDDDDCLEEYEDDD